MADLRTGSIVQQLRRTVLRESRDGLSDSVLLQGFIAERDGAAFEALVQRHGPMVWGVCRRVLRNQHDAEDAFQATLLVLARKAGSVSPREKLANWLYGVACQTAVRARCARAKRQMRERQVVDMPEPVARDQALWDNLPMLDQEIARLHSRYREVVVLCDLQGRTRREVARQLSIPEGTVASRLATGRKTLAKRLARYGLPISGGTLATILSQNMLSAAAPTSAVSAAIHAATFIATGQAAILKVVPARVAVLADDVVKAMLLAKLKTVTVALLVLGMIAVGGRLVAHQFIAAEPDVSHATKDDQPQPEKPSAPVLDTPRKDRFGDPLPAGAIVRLGTLRFRHPNWVTGLAYTPDDKTLVSTCRDGGVRLWEPATGKELRCFSSDAARFGVAVTPDGKTLIAIGNGEDLRALDLASGKQRWHVIADYGHTIALAPDGKTIAKGLHGDKNQQISFWNVDTGKHIRTLGATNRIVPALAFSRDGKLLAAGDGPPRGKADMSSVWLWDPTDGRRVRELKGHTDGVAAVAFSPTGTLLASASHDSSIRLWNPVDGQLIRMISVPQERHPPDELGPNSSRQLGGVLAIAFSADGRWLASGGYDGSVHLWDVDTGKAVHTMRGHGREVTSLVFSRDGKVLTSGSYDHTIRLWNPVTGKELQARDGHSGPVRAVAVSPNGRLAASACDDRSIHLWSLATGQELRILSGHTDDVFSVAFSPDGRALASASADHTIRIWDTETGQELRQLLGHQNAVYTVAFSKVKNLLVSSGADRTLRFWDWSNAKQMRQISSEGALYDVSLSRDGRIVGAGSKQARFWEVATGKEVRRAGPPWAHVALASDGQTFVTRSENGIVQAWNLASGKEQWAFLGAALSSNYAGQPSILLSPDGRLLAASDRSGTTVWEMSTGKVRRHFSGRHRFSPFAFSADGRTLLTGSEDTTILVWDLARRHENQPDRLAPAKLESLWRDLGGADAERADQAIGTLAARPEQSVPFLDKKSVPVKVADPKRLAVLLRDIDSDDFTIRDRAVTDLRNLGEQAAAALNKALEKPPSIEARRRIEKLLTILRPPFAASELLQSLRAVEVLERIDTPETRTLLRRLAAGSPDARLTQDAINALTRLDQRRD